jgi:hypothetical protein
MVPIGAGLSGYALYALLVWMPMWRMASTPNADGIFKYFLVVMMLVFGVFMVSGGRSSFSIVRFGPGFIAGAVCSAAVAGSMWWLLAAGLAGLALAFIMFGE